MGSFCIDAEKMYSLTQAARMIPSVRGDYGISPGTIHRWRQEGRFQARRIGGRWFVRGSEILKLLAADEPAVVKPKEEKNPSHEAAMATLKALGVDV